MDIMCDPVCEPLVSSYIDYRWLACRLVTLDSIEIENAVDEMFGSSLLFYSLFEGLPDVNTTYFMFMVVVLTDVLR